MAGLSNREVAERFARALSENDLDTQDALVADDFTMYYPQSGELIRGRANRRATIENYPGAEGGLKPKLGEVIGSDDRWVTTPSWTVVHLSGSGDEFVLTGTMEYPNGETWHAVDLLTIRDGKIHREVSYFAPPFEAPAWRSEYVERDDSA